MTKTTAGLRVPRALFLYTLATSLLVGALAVIAHDPVTAGTSVAIAIGSILALRGTTWGSLALLLAGAAASATSIARDAPWWTLAHGLTALVAAASITPALLRRDRSAALALVAIVVALGAGIGVGVSALAPPEDVPYTMPVVDELGEPLIDVCAVRARAARDANEDTLDGHVHLLVHGLMGGDDPYESLLRTQLDTEYVSVGGCALDDESMERAAVYNGIIISYLEARYGEGVLDRLWREARPEVDFGRPRFEAGY